MAWVEKSGKKTYRVRYFTDDGTIGSVPGFPTNTAAAVRDRWRRVVISGAAAM